MDTEVAGPGFLPTELVVTGLHQSQTCIAHIVEATANQCEVLVVGDCRVTRGTCRELQLGVGQPARYVREEVLVAKVPHECCRPEHTPAVSLTETRRCVGTQSCLGKVAVLVVVLATSKERQEAVVRVGGVIPARCAGCGGDIGQSVVVLSCGRNAESLVVVVDTLVTHKEVERVVFVHIKLVVDGVGHCQRVVVGRATRCRALSLVGSIARERLCKAC